MVWEIQWACSNGSTHNSVKMHVFLHDSVKRERADVPTYIMPDLGICVSDVRAVKGTYDGHGLSPTIVQVPLPQSLEEGDISTFTASRRHVHLFPGPEARFPAPVVGRLFVCHSVVLCVVLHKRGLANTAGLCVLIVKGECPTDLAGMCVTLRSDDSVFL